ncbi:MAG: hypothetical protein ACPGQM_00210 [Alphaproteobacteria bacterium]
MREFVFLNFLVLSLAPLAAVAQTDTGPDILCENASPGTVAEIPPPVAKWIILLYTERGRP